MFLLICLGSFLRRGGNAPKRQGTSGVSPPQCPYLHFVYSVQADLQRSEVFNVRFLPPPPSYVMEQGLRSGAEACFYSWLLPTSKWLYIEEYLYCVSFKCVVGDVLLVLSFFYQEERVLPLACMRRKKKKGAWHSIHVVRGAFCS